MTSGADPRLVERIAATQSRVQARSADISERVKATSARFAERFEQRREENQARNAELDKSVEDRIAAKDNPNANNQWLQRSEAKDRTFQFGDDDGDDRGQNPPSVPPRAPAVPPPAPVQQENARGRHARREAFDDDDFSNNNWLQ